MACSGTAGGGGLWHALYKYALTRGLTDWVTSMAAQDLIIANGRVAGVVAVHQETGEEQTFLAMILLRTSKNVIKIYPIKFSSVI